jgi:outer membrane receptor protein involved in Fe transport
MNKKNHNLHLRHRKKSSIALCLLSALLTPGLVQAQANEDDAKEIERIIVTSDLRQQSPDNLATSVAVLGESLLELRQATHLEDVLAVVPNLNFSSGASRGKFIQIRGIGERSQFAEPINPSVALVVDEINFSGLGGLGTLFDVQQVEVLSGPQSTGFGATGLAGIVKIVSNQSTDFQEGFVQLGLGQFGAQKWGGAYSDQVAEGLTGRVAIQQVKHDGFVENTFLDRDDTNNIDEFTAKLSLDYKVSDDADLELKLYHFDIDNGYDAFSLDNDNITRSDEPGFDRTDTQAGSLKYIHSWDESQFSIAVTQLEAELDYAYDEDWTFVGFHPDEYSSFDRYTRDISNQSLDARFASTQEQPWVIGLYYQSSEQALLRQYTFASGDFTSTYDPSSFAVYGEYSMQVSDPLSITLGGRAERFEADYLDSTAFSESLDDTLFAAKVSAQYKINKASIFSSISRSYKAGGFNPDERVSDSDRLFAPEYNWNYELGVKGNIASENGVKGQLSLTFFYMEREDAQVSDFAVLERQDGSGAVEFIDVIGNADTGLNKGMEVQTNWQLNDSLAIRANVGYLDASFGNYETVDGSFVPKQFQAQAPKWTLYASTHYAFTDTLSWLVEFEGKDRHRFSVGHDETAPFTGVVNTHLTWQSANVELQLWAKNIFDRELLTRGFGGFNNDPRDGYFPAKPYYQFGQERQVGITATYRF